MVAELGGGVEVGLVVVDEECLAGIDGGLAEDGLVDFGLGLLEVHLIGEEDVGEPV